MCSPHLMSTPCVPQSSSNWQLQRKCPEAYKALQVILLLLTLLIVLSFLFAGLASGKLEGSTENVERDLQRGGRVPDLVRVPAPIAY